MAGMPAYHESINECSSNEANRGCNRGSSDLNPGILPNIADKIGQRTDLSIFSGNNESISPNCLQIQIPQHYISTVYVGPNCIVSCLKHYIKFLNAAGTF